MDNAPSNLASIGRYVLTPDIFETLGLSRIGGEIQLADAINIQAKRGSVGSLELTDCALIAAQWKFIEALILYLIKEKQMMDFVIKQVD